MSRLRSIGWAAALLLLTADMVVQLQSGNASDKNWLLFAAGEWLSGKTLYRDIIEVNPPLIIWLFSGAVWISRQLPFLKDYHALVLSGFAAIALVITLSVRLIALHPAFEGEKYRQWLFALLLAFVFVFFTAPMFFFDREHILLVLTFPYVLRFMPGLALRELPLSTRLAVGAIGAIGFCIKPQSVIVFAAIQLLYIVRERSAAIFLSTENLIIYAVAGLYITSILLFMPDYLHVVVPMAVATYSAYSRKATGVFHLILFIVMTGLTFADFRRRYASPFRSGVYYFLGLSFAYLGYALLNNGWAYTYQPALSLSRILAGWVLMEFVWLRRDALAHGQPAKPFANGVISCGFNLAVNVLFFTFCVAASFFSSGAGVCNAACRSSLEFSRQFRALHVRSFGVMAVQYYTWTALARETGAQWDTRFNHLWMLPMFLKEGPEFADKNRWITTYVGEAYAEDIKRWKPEAIFVDTSPEIYSGHARIDIPGYYSVAPAFKEAWGQYVKSGVIATCVTPTDPDAESVKTDCQYDIYRRVAP